MPWQDTPDMQGWTLVEAYVATGSDPASKEAEALYHWSHDWRVRTKTAQVIFKQAGLEAYVGFPLKPLGTRMEDLEVVP